MESLLQSTPVPLLYNAGRVCPKARYSTPLGGHPRNALLNGFRNHVDMKDTDIIMIFKVKKKKKFGFFSFRNGCLFSKYCIGSFSRSNLSPEKEELSQHAHADINTSLELYISRGSSDREPGSLPHKELSYKRQCFISLTNG